MASVLQLLTGAADEKAPAPRSDPAARCGADRRHAPHHHVNGKTVAKPSKKSRECDGCPPYYKPRINPARPAGVA